MKILKQMQSGQIHFSIVVAVAAVALVAGFFLDNVFSTKSISCYLSLERPCYDKSVHGKDIETGASGKNFDMCVKNPKSFQGEYRLKTEKCSQSYQFDITYDESVKYCSLGSSGLMFRKFEGSCVPPIINTRVWGFNPMFGPVGTKVTISGYGFTPTDNYIMLYNWVGGIFIPTPFSSENGRTITFTIPSAGVLNFCLPQGVCEGCYCSDPSLIKEVVIVPGEYTIGIFNANGLGVHVEGGPGGIGVVSDKFTVTAANQ